MRLNAVVGMPWRRTFTPMFPVDLAEREMSPYCDQLHACTPIGTGSRGTMTTVGQPPRIPTQRAAPARRKPSPRMAPIRGAGRIASIPRVGSTEFPPPRFPSGWECRHSRCWGRCCWLPSGCPRSASRSRWSCSAALRAGLAQFRRWLWHWWRCGRGSQCASPWSVRFGACGTACSSDPVGVGCAALSSGTSTGFWRVCARSVVRSQDARAGATSCGRGYRWPQCLC